MQLVENASFEQTVDGYAVGLYTLRNKNGMVAQITNYGARLVSLFTPDRQGHWADTVLGYDHLQSYLTDPYYMGATIGRYANRIAQGRFSLYGEEYRLPRNDGEHHLHGANGLQNKFWFVNRFSEQEIELHCSSFDGEEGYPGRISVTAVYRLREDDTLHILFTATTDLATVLNLTHHTYFNLSGGQSADIRNHRLQLNAHYFTPVDASGIPTGEVLSVENTPFDFRRSATIGERLAADHEQLHLRDGFDHNWVVLNGQRRIKSAARVTDPLSGRQLEVFASQPGIQFYSGQGLNGVRGKFGRKYGPLAGFSLQPQYFPDSPHHPHFPLAVLLPGQVYRHEIIYKFTVDKRDAV